MVESILGKTAMAARRIVSLPCAVLVLAAATCNAAPVPDAWWNGNFAENATFVGTSGITYSISGNGNTIANGIVTIATDAQLGLGINASADLGNNVAILVKYRRLPDTSAAAVATVKTTDNKTSGARIKTAGSGVLTGYYQAADGNSYDFDNSPSAGADGGYILFSTATGAGTACHTGNSLESLSGGANTSLKWSGRTIKDFAIGGPCADTYFPACSGMEIEAVAIFRNAYYSGATVTDFADFSFPVERRVEYAKTAIAVSEINADSGANADDRVYVTVPEGARVSFDTPIAFANLVFVSKGKLTLSAEERPNEAVLSKIDVSLVEGSVMRSWLDASAGIGYNFKSESGSDTSSALLETPWGSDASDNMGQADLFGDGLTRIAWSSHECYSYAGTSILNGYLDDNVHNGNGAEIYVTGIPYETYDVVIYASSDTQNASFLSKTVNGKPYVWDSSAAATVEGDKDWGKAALPVPSYGLNALRINNLSGPLTIFGGAKGSASRRGGIAAIQIVPSGTPDIERTYKLTIGDAPATWSTGDWTLDGEAVEAPVYGNVEVLFASSQTLSVDVAVNLRSLSFVGRENAALTLAAVENGRIYALESSLAGGVLRQGTEAILGATPKIAVLSGATFDLNGHGVSSANEFVISGAGAGDWPWAVTSSGGDSPVGSFMKLTLASDSTVGGSNRIRLGADAVQATLALNGHTLSKTGSCELVCYNVRCAVNGTGTIDIKEGIFTLTKYCNLDGSNLDGIYSSTRLILRDGARLMNTTDRTVWVDEFDFIGGTVTANNPIGVKSAFTGSGSISKIVFDKGAEARLTGLLVITDSFALSDYGSGSREHTGGSVSFAKAPDAESAELRILAGFTCDGLLSAASDVSVNVGLLRPVAELDVKGTLKIALAAEDDSITLRATAMPRNIDVFEADGTTPLDYFRSSYDGSTGLLAIVRASNPFPAIENDAEVQWALAGSADAKLLENITTAYEYSSYRQWALSLENTEPEAVKASPCAWLSYALDLDALVASAPQRGDLAIEEFRCVPAEDCYIIVVSLKGVSIGNDAKISSLKKTFAVEGAGELAGGLFSSADIDYAVEAVGGKAVFRVAPKTDSQGIPVKTYFYRVVIR